MQDLCNFYNKYIKSIIYIYYIYYILVQNASHLLFGSYYKRYYIFLEVKCQTIYTSLQVDGCLMLEIKQLLFKSTQVLITYVYPTIENENTCD